MNPYDVLQVDQDADSRTVIRAAAQALRVRRYTAKEIAAAQKELLDPVNREVRRFLHELDLAPLKRPIPKAQPKAPPPLDLERLSIFEEAS